MLPEWLARNTNEDVGDQRITESEAGERVKSTAARQKQSQARLLERPTEDKKNLTIAKGTPSVVLEEKGALWLFGRRG